VRVGGQSFRNLGGARATLLSATGIGTALVHWMLGGLTKGVTEEDERLAVAVRKAASR